MVKLQPKKASSGASPAEMELMRQLDEMKALIKSLQEQNLMMAKNGGGSNANNDALMAEAMKNLMAKQAELNNVLTGGGSDDYEAKAMEKQREEYASRGMFLT